MQERHEETVSIPEVAEGKLSAEVAAMELAENKEVELKQGMDAEERQRGRHHHHGPPHHGHPHHGPPHHGHPHQGHPHHGHPHHGPPHHGHHRHPLHNLLHRHIPHHHHHKEKKWEKLEKKRMKKGCEGGWNSKFIGKLKHKLEKIDWKIESLQEKKLFILRRIQEIEAEEQRKQNEGGPVPTAPALMTTDAAA